MPEEDRSIVHDVSLAAAVGRRALPMRLCTAFAESLGAQHVTMSLLPSFEQWQLLYASDEYALRAEAAQFAHADGPSIDAALGTRTVLVPDVPGQARHARLRRWADDLPALRHVLALPLHRQRQRLGVLCLYYTRSAPPAPAHIAEAERATALAREEILRWRPVHADADSPEPVWATDTRAARWERVHRAAGYIAAREECPVAEALNWLRVTSVRRHQSLLDTCDHVLQPVGAQVGVDRRAALTR
ncbi:GAF domain-containing protein [Streptomyces sp. NPDC051684]|uniref:GAF domain-containing protein n=1 Tax=Streptomyces sp. NPDC051684 TaxID=3365670 RepID=UPI00379F9D43